MTKKPHPTGAFRPHRVRTVEAIGLNDHQHITVPIPESEHLTEGEIVARAAELTRAIAAVGDDIGQADQRRALDLYKETRLYEQLGEMVIETVKRTCGAAARQPNAPPLRATRRAIEEKITSEEFRTQFAHDVLRHAFAWTLIDLEKLIALDPSLSDDHDAREKAYDKLFFDGGYFGTATARLFPNYAEAMLRSIGEQYPEGVAFIQRLNKTLHALLIRGPNQIDTGQVAAAALVQREDGHIEIPTPQPLLALLSALNNAASRNGWDDFGGTRPPTHTTITGKKRAAQGAVYVTVRGADGALSPSDTALTDLWEQVRALDDLTSDVLIVCLAACVQADGPAWVDVDQILDARGIAPIKKRGEPKTWRHGHRTEDRVAVGRALSQLDALWLELDNLEVIPAGKRRKGQHLKWESRAVILTDKITQIDLDGETVLRAARVTLGEWAGEYRKLEVRQIGLLARKALEYDPYRQQPEKRLAKYLAFHYRSNRERLALHRTVRNLLDAATILVDEERPGLARQRLDKTLDRLKEDGIIGQWRPMIDADQIPARRWLAPWLASVIIIEPPATVQGRYLALRPSQRRADKGSSS